MFSNNLPSATLIVVDWPPIKRVIPIKNNSKREKKGKKNHDYHED
jgi:hypothetical protein